MATNNHNFMDPQDRDFLRRLEGALQTVRAWEDPALLAECRATIPLSELHREDGPYSDLSKDPDDTATRYFQRLCRYFQKSMTWVNRPSCPQCATDATVQQIHVRPAETTAEQEGHASRVEVYQCTQCQSNVTFPRYNAPQTLLHTRQGRCGEYANLFGLYCRASGFCTRYILDFTDHVWTEVYLPHAKGGEWYCMGDGCEGVIAEPSMYEAGWGKQLSYVVAVTTDCVIDVTPRYTRQFANNNDEFMARRRSVTTSEPKGQEILQYVNQTLLWSKLSDKAQETVKARHAQEEHELSQLKQATSWETTTYASGRQSGAMEWKVARGEAGTTEKSLANNGGSSYPSSTQHFVETFLPSTKLTKSSIALHPHPKKRAGAIVISGASCALGETNKLSTVVVDAETGCILQSKALASLPDLAAFVNTMPDARIILIHGRLEGPKEKEVDSDAICKEAFQRLGGFASNLAYEEGVLYAGQVGGPIPDWSVCQSLTEASTPVEFTLAPQNASSTFKLRTYPNTQATAVIGRVSETIMPLATQTLANHVQKQKAFEAYLNEMEKSSSSVDVLGYCTKAGAPIYLLGSNSFPFEPCENWACFLRLPAGLVPDHDLGAASLENSPAKPSLAYEVPVDTNAFVEQLGPQLLTQQNTLVDTGLALQNCRLVAFYFSAHWCGPCRSFTPMLAEFYAHLKEEFPSHGMEIVFVSSDRDEGSFQNYYRTMPWLAVPFSSLAMYKQTLSFKFGVKGIPSLVVLDALTGAVVVDARTSRGELIQACRRGEDFIVDQFHAWLSRVPPESKEILDLLKVSCNVTETKAQEKNDPKVESFLFRKSNTSTDKDTAAIVKEKFEELTKGGMSPNDAAAKAIAYASSNPTTTPKALTGALKESKIESPDHEKLLLAESGEDGLKDVLVVALKYIGNVKREPWNHKFRIIKLSNKVADRIASVPHALPLLCSHGFEVSSIPEDFVAFIPPGIDVDALYQCLADMLNKASTDV